MSEPTLSLGMTSGEAPADAMVCEKHTILFPISHTGGLFHPYVAICPFCRADRLEAFCVEKDRKIAEQAEEIERLREEVEDAEGGSAWA